MEFTARQIADFLQGEIVGNEEAKVHTFAKIEEAVPGSLTFLSNEKYAHYIYDTKADIVLVNKDFVPEKEIGATLIKVNDAREALGKLLTLYTQSMPKRKGIDPLAFVAKDVQIGENVYIGPFAVIEQGVRIGDNTEVRANCYLGEHVTVGSDCLLYPGVNVYHDCRLGNRIILHSGVVIGADGFGFAPTPNGYEKIPQIGIVEIEDDVEIGANSCVDRATMGKTVIHQGVKLDNLVQIAHNDEIGAHTVMSSQVGVAGSTKVGQWCVFAGQVGVADHLNIGDHVQLGAKAGAPSHIADNMTCIGSPATDPQTFFKSVILSRKLPQLNKEVQELRREIEELKKLLKND